MALRKNQKAVIGVEDKRAHIYGEKGQRAFD
jgi:hypothetical protein